MDEEFDGDFPASESTPGQTESRVARLSLENWLKKQDARPAWFELWEDLREERAPLVGKDGELLLNERGQVRTRRRWDWRKALYIAWASLPRYLREPKTLEGLVSLLGLSSSGTIRNWRRNDPGIIERIASVPAELLLEHVADVLHALTVVASDADPKAHQDRKLFLELTKVYTPKGGLVVTGPDDGPVPMDITHGLGKLSDDELDALDSLVRRLGSDAGGEGPPPAD
jgi:hypothetical protein